VPGDIAKALSAAASQARQPQVSGPSAGVQS